MGYAMAKVAAILCIALLVAHVDGARNLKQVTGDVTTAEARTIEVSTLTPPVDESVPAPDTATEYNYAADDSSSNTTDAAGQLASGGFLVPSPPLNLASTEVFPGVDADAQDQGTDPVTTAAEEPVQEGHLWQPEGETDGSDGVATASFADENNGGFLVDSPDSDSVATASFADENNGGFLVDSPDSDSVSTASFADENNGGFLVDSPDADSVATASFADENNGGFLVDSPDSDSVATASFADENNGGFLVDSTDPDSVATASFADDNNGGFSVNSPDTDGNTQPYDFDATTQDAESVYPQGGDEASLSSVFDTPYVPAEDTTEQETPEFVFDETEPEFGN